MGKIAFVSGAGSGIGKATAIALAEKGYHLILTGRRKPLLEKLAAEIQRVFAVRVLVLEMDVRKTAETMEKIGGLGRDHVADEHMGGDDLGDERSGVGREKSGGLQVMQEEIDWRKIDILVNNAGLAAGLDHFQDADFADWEAMIDTNIRGLLAVSQPISRMMAERKQGHIINISSIAGTQVYEKGNVYCATKHAVEAISKSMRIDLLKQGIRVTTISPGAVETEFSMVRFKNDTERARQVYTGYQPLTPEDIANAIVYAIAQPAHVNINAVEITPVAQANAFYLDRQIPSL